MRVCNRRVGVNVKISVKKSFYKLMLKDGQLQSKS